jgi:hypothetical protein
VDLQWPPVLGGSEMRKRLCLRRGGEAGLLRRLNRELQDDSV